MIKRVQSSGALPISRDTPSYHMIISILYGGATSSQLEYIFKELRLSLGRSAGAEGEEGSEDAQALPWEDQAGAGEEGDLNSTQTEYWSSRSEAKRAHNERMEAQRLVSGSGVRSGFNGDQWVILLCFIGSGRRWHCPCSRRP